MLTLYPQLVLEDASMRGNCQLNPGHPVGVFRFNVQQTSHSSENERDDRPPTSNHSGPHRFEKVLRTNGREQKEQWATTELPRMRRELLLAAKEAADHAVTTRRSPQDSRPTKRSWLLTSRRPIPPWHDNCDPALLSWVYTRWPTWNADTHCISGRPSCTGSPGT